MKKLTVSNAKQIKDLNAQLSKLQSELLLVNKATGIDEYIGVKKMKSQSRFGRVKIKGSPDKGLGHYLMVIDVTAKKQNVFIPLSIASSKKATGMVYQIEGTADGSVATAKVSARGEGVTKVTLGTLVYVKIPEGKTASLNVQIEIKGKIGKMYKFIIHRINYKLAVTDARYSQYSKELVSDNLKFS